MKLRLRKIGNSCGLILPQKLLKKLQNAKAGDEILAIEEEEGVMLTHYDPNFTRAMRAYEKFSKKYRNALKELSKK